jgi:hypothetical protein
MGPRFPAVRAARFFRPAAVCGDVRCSEGVTEFVFSFDSGDREPGLLTNSRILFLIAGVRLLFTTAATGLQPLTLRRDDETLCGDGTLRGEATWDDSHHSRSTLSDLCFLQQRALRAGALRQAVGEMYVCGNARKRALRLRSFDAISVAHLLSVCVSMPRRSPFSWH